MTRPTASPSVDSQEATSYRAVCDVIVMKDETGWSLLCTNILSLPTDE